MEIVVKILKIQIKSLQNSRDHTKEKSYGARQNYDRGTRVSKDVNESFDFSAMLESYQEKGLDYIREMNEDVELLDEKNKPTNPALWSRAKAAAGLSLMYIHQHMQMVGSLNGIRREVVVGNL